MPVLADVLMLLAFVDVLQDHGYAIRSVSWPAWAQLLVFRRADLRALFTTVAPGVADAAATRGFRHRRGHVEDALRLAGTVFETREAKRLASICAR